MRLQNLLTLYPWLRGAALVGFLITAMAQQLLDRRSGWLFSSVTIILAIVVVLCPLFLPSKSGWVIALSPVAWLLSMLLLHLVLPPWPSKSDIERSGAQIIQQLEAYHSAHGSYPESLEAAGIRSPRYRCGSFQYQRESPNKFTLGIGNYVLDEFEAWWQPDKKSWYWDT